MSFLMAPELHNLFYGILAICSGPRDKSLGNIYYRKIERINAEPRPCQGRRARIEALGSGTRVSVSTGRGIVEARKAPRSNVELLNKSAENQKNYMIQS
jgi:hypothetical protein